MRFVLLPSHSCISAVRCLQWLESEVRLAMGTDERAWLRTFEDIPHYELQGQAGVFWMRDGFTASVQIEFGTNALDHDCGCGREARMSLAFSPTGTSMRARWIAGPVPAIAKGGSSSRMSAG